MPYKGKGLGSSVPVPGRSPGRPRRRFDPPSPSPNSASSLPDDAGFGGELSIPAFDLSDPADKPSKPSAALIALGAPPADAAGIEKWNYQVLSTMAYEVMISETISDATRQKRVSALLSSAAKHYPDAAKYDLAQQIKRDDDRMNDKKRARAAAKPEARPAAGGAKVIPIRSDG
jgi:hypothetical protein